MLSVIDTANYPVSIEQAIAKSYPDKDGNIIFNDPEHPLAKPNGVVKTSRHVASVSAGRWVEEHEVVFFLDHNKANLDPDNLRIIIPPDLAWD